MESVRIVFGREPDAWDEDQSTDGYSDSSQESVPSPASMQTSDASVSYHSDSSDTPSIVQYDEEHPNMYVPWNMKHCSAETIRAWTSAFNAILELGDSADLTPYLSKLSTKVIDEPDGDGFSLLGVACYKGYPNIVDQLLLAGASPNKYTEDSALTPLWRAVLKCQVECVKRLVEGDVNVNSEIGTALHFAAEFVLRGVHRASQDKGEGARRKNEAILELLLNKGADVHCTDYMGHTPLVKACINNNACAVRLFLERGADPLERFYCIAVSVCTPLDYAASFGATESLKLIVDKIVFDQNLVKRERAMEVAVTKGHSDCVRCLVEAGFDADMGVKLPPDEMDRFRQLDRAVPMLACIQYVDLETLVKYLLSKGASPLYLNQPIRTPLKSCPIYKAFLLSSRYLRLFLEYCADMDGLDTRLGRQPVVFPVEDLWIWRKPSSRFKILLEAGFHLKLELVRCDKLRNRSLKTFEKVAKMWWTLTGRISRSRYMTALGSLAESPVSLSALCRATIRTCIGFPRLAKLERSVRLLPIPPHLQEYLAHL